ncbi:MAG: hypothetical protein JNL21_23250 [Myxococcales bacterium]|nr:hypothetical protein [Myxococcales bacterium]
MPLLVTPLLAFAIGTLLALGPRGPLDAREQRFATMGAAAYAALCFFPAAAWAAATQPSWALAYVIDGGRVPAVLLVAVAAASSVLVLLGLRAGLSFAQATVDRRAALSAAPLAAAAVVLVFQADRLGVVGTHLAFVRASERGLEPLLSSRFGVVLAVHDALIVAGALLTYRAMAALGDAPSSEPKPRFGRPKLGRPPVTSGGTNPFG